jgi:hypothetical protein
MMAPPDGIKAASPEDAASNHCDHETHPDPPLFKTYPYPIFLDRPNHEPPSLTALGFWLAGWFPTFSGLYFSDQYYR